MKKYFLLIILTACATMQTVNIENRSRIYDADYNRVLKAIISYCNEYSFPVNYVNENLGIITTDYRENDGTSKLLIGNYRTKLNYNVSKIDENKTKVVVHINYEEQGTFGAWKQATLTESKAIEIYETVLNRINERL